MMKEQIEKNRRTFELIGTFCCALLAAGVFSSIAGSVGHKELFSFSQYWLVRFSIISFSCYFLALALVWRLMASFRLNTSLNWFFISFVGSSATLLFCSLAYSQSRGKVFQALSALNEPSFWFIFDLFIGGFLLLMGIIRLAGFLYRVFPQIFPPSADSKLK